MPWKKGTAMDEKLRFISKSLEPGANIAELCRDFGIARSTGHKLLHRYHREGLRVLEERSRRPLTTPQATAAELIMAIVNYKTSYPSRGARKIRMKLLSSFGEGTPSISTINRILERCGLQERRRRRGKSLSKMANPTLTQALYSNCVWTADYKGWWRTRNGSRCEPLTVRDEYSRFILDIAALPGTKMELAKERFRRIFEQFGLPETIRTDNGSPFCSTSAVLGLSKLSVWWIKLGIEPQRIPLGKPYHNGGHERMHRDIAQDLEKNPATTLVRQQDVFDGWREEFNTERPHDALGLKCPAQVYSASRRKYDSRDPEFDYPKHHDVRRIDNSGRLYVDNKRISLSKTLAGQHVAIERFEDECVIWFCNFMLGKTDRRFRFLTTPAGVVKPLEPEPRGKEIG